MTRSKRREHWPVMCWPSSMAATVRRARCARWAVSQACTGHCKPPALLLPGAAAGQCRGRAVSGWAAWIGPHVPFLKKNLGRGTPVGGPC